MRRRRGRREQRRREKKKTERRKAEREQMNECVNEGQKQRKTERDGHKQRKEDTNERRRGRGKRRRGRRRGWSCCLLLFVGCLSSQQHASVSQGRIFTDNFTCCHTEIETADQTFHLTQSQYTDTGPTSPSADPITPGAWQGSHWSANF